MPIRLISHTHNTTAVVVDRLTISVSVTTAQAPGHIVPYAHQTSTSSLLPAPHTGSAAAMVSASRVLARVLLLVYCFLVFFYKNRAVYAPHSVTYNCSTPSISGQFVRAFFFASISAASRTGARVTHRRLSASRSSHLPHGTNPQQ